MSCMVMGSHHSKDLSLRHKLSHGCLWREMFHLQRWCATHDSLLWHFSYCPGTFCVTDLFSLQEPFEIVTILYLSPLTSCRTLHSGNGSCSDRKSSLNSEVAASLSERMGRQVFVCAHPTPAPRPEFCLLLSLLPKPSNYPYNYLNLKLKKQNKTKNQQIIPNSKAKQSLLHPPITALIP